MVRRRMSYNATHLCTSPLAVGSCLRGLILKQWSCLSARPCTLSQQSKWMSDCRLLTRQDVSALGLPARAAGGGEPAAAREHGAHAAYMTSQIPCTAAMIAVEVRVNMERQGEVVQNPVASLRTTSLRTKLVRLLLRAVHGG